MLKPRAVQISSDRVQFFVNHDGATHKVIVPGTILDDLDRTNHRSVEAVTQSFNKHLELIIARSTAALESGRRGDGNGAIILGLADFPEA